MKYISNSMLIVALALCVGLSVIGTGCEGDNDASASPEDNLVGFWLLNRVLMVGPAEIDLVGSLVAGDIFDPSIISWVFSLHLRADNTYTISQSIYGEAPTIENGTWSADAATLTLYLGDAVDTYPYTRKGPSRCIWPRVRILISRRTWKWSDKISRSYPLLVPRPDLSGAFLRMRILLGVNSTSSSSLI